MEMTNKEISERKEMDKKRGERAKEPVRMPKLQTMWGILMLLSLSIMVTGGIFAVGSRKGWAGSAQGKELSHAVAGGDVAAPGEETRYLSAGQGGKENPVGGTDEGGEPEIVDGQGKPAPDEGKEAETIPESGGPAGTTSEGSKEEGMPQEDGETETLQEDADAPTIAITFDDGPYTAVTNRILDVLLEYGAGATFFVVGSRIDMYSDTLKRIYENGFEVASHTWSHKNLNKLSKEDIQKELNDTKERLALYIPVGDAMLVRPPYGSANETVRGIVGMPLINWSLDSEDWKSRDAGTILKHVLSTVKDGDIILMHDLYESTAEAVEELVPELVAQGYKIVSVSELFSRKGIPLEEGILYRNPWDHY